MRSVRPVQPSSLAYSSSMTRSHHSLLHPSPGTSRATWLNQLSFFAPCQCFRSCGGLPYTGPALRQILNRPFGLTRTNQPPPALRTLLRAGGGFCRSSFFFHLEQDPQQPCQTFGASHHDHLHPVFLPSTFTRHTGADGFAASAPVYPREYRFVTTGAAFCTVSVRQDKPQLPAPLLTTLRRRPGWRSPQPAPSPPSTPPRPQRRRCSPQGENPP